jgi:ribokinase
VVAGLPNPLAAEVLQAPGARVRFFAPALRNMLDRDRPLAGFAGSIDVLSCNLREWEALEGRDDVARAVPIVAITDGPRGSRVLFRAPDGRPGAIQIPAFPRDHPPRDTNRAGEAYASTLIMSLLEAGWPPGPAEAELIREAARRASATAALEIDLLGFGFPDRAAIDAALRAGVVAGVPDDGIGRPG